MFSSYSRINRGAVQIAVTALVALLLAPLSASANGAGAYYPDTFPSSSEQSFTIMDGETSDYIPSHIVVLTGDPDFGQDQHLCDNAADAFGASADVLGRDSGDPCGLTSLLEEHTMVTGRVLLEPCLTEAQEFCIESLSLGTDTMTTASVIRTTAGPRFTGEGRVGDAVPTEGLGEFSGGTVSLWDSSVLHDGGVGTYAVNVAALVTADFSYDGEGTKTAYNGLVYSGLSASVTPYKDLDTTSDSGFSLTDVVLGEDASGTNQYVYWSGGDGPRCAYAEDNLCGRIYDFAAGTTVSLALRVPKELGGFFKGRLASPNIEITSLSDTSQKITVTGEPIEVPRLEHTMATADIDRTEVVYDEGDFQLTTEDLGIFVADGSGNPEGGIRGGTPASQPGAFDIITWLKNKTGVDDTISGKNTIWSFGTVTEQVSVSDTIDSSDPLLCLADTTTVLGVVTSNAMAYQDSPPSLDYDSEGNQSLGYVVAGLHYDVDGVTEITGTYDLLLRSDVARCLYPDLAALPEGDIDADVSVTEIPAAISDTANVKETTVSISESDGWLKLSASGFTFSTNEISVSLKSAVADDTTTGGGGSAVVVVTEPPAQQSVPSIPSGETAGVLVGGVVTPVTVAPNLATGTLVVGGTDWNLSVAPSATGGLLDATGRLRLDPQVTPVVVGDGFQSGSAVSAYLVSQTQQAAGFSVAASSVYLGQATADASGGFSKSLDLSAVTSGDYILQINGAAPNGDLRSISIRATVLNLELKGWTKKLNDTEVKAYVKNVVGAGKVQIFVNGKEIAWVRAADESDPKLRKANGFNYLVRTIDLKPGKNRIEIKVDGERVRFVTYTKSD